MAFLIIFFFHLVCLCVFARIIILMFLVAYFARGFLEAKIIYKKKTLLYKFEVFDKKKSFEHTQHKIILFLSKSTFLSMIWFEVHELFVSLTMRDCLDKPFTQRMIFHWFESHEVTVSIIKSPNIVGVS